TSSPDATVRETPWSTSTAPYATVTSSSVSKGLVRSEIGANDLGVALDLRRRALRDLLAVVQDDDPVAEAHHQLHVVLHEQHAHSAGPHIGDEPHQPDRLHGI